jgi:hypothetical protein
VPLQVPTVALIVRPTTTAFGLKLGAAVLLGAIRIGPNPALNVTADSVPGLLVAVVAVTFATKYFPTQFWFSETEAVVRAVEVQPDGMELEAFESALQ